MNQLLQLLNSSWISNISKHISIIIWLLMIDIIHMMLLYKWRLRIYLLLLYMLVSKWHVILPHNLMINLTNCICHTSHIVPIHIHLIIHWILLWSYNARCFATLEIMFLFVIRFMCLRFLFLLYIIWLWIRYFISLICLLLRQLCYCFICYISLCCKTFKSLTSFLWS